MERHITCHTKFESAFQISRVATLRRKTRVTRAATGRSADLMWEIFIYSDGQIGESTLAALFELRYIRHNVNGQTPTVTWCNIDVSTNITICTLMIDAETGEDSWDSIRRFFCFRFRFVFFSNLKRHEFRSESFGFVPFSWVVLAGRAPGNRSLLELNVSSAFVVMCEPSAVFLVTHWLACWKVFLKTRLFDCNWCTEATLDVASSYAVSVVTETKKKQTKNRCGSQREIHYLFKSAASSSVSDVIGGRNSMEFCFPGEMATCKLIITIGID